MTFPRWVAKKACSYAIGIGMAVAYWHNTEKVHAAAEWVGVGIASAWGGACDLAGWVGDNPVPLATAVGVCVVSGVVGRMTHKS